MAVFTPLSLADAERVFARHGLGAVERITPIPAGSVNSNFFVDGPERSVFLRIYEEQEEDGVAYEWALLDHLAAASVPVPRRIGGTLPGEVRVAGKPVALFERIGGSESCQRGVTVARAAEVGLALGRVHRAVADFGWRRQGRFTTKDVKKRIEQARSAGRDELTGTLDRLEASLEEVLANQPPDLPSGVVHGDLFRDNVRWEDDRIVALIDWESASDGAFGYDVMVTVLAWSFGDRFEWDLARAMVEAYDRERPLSPLEWSSLRLLGQAAAVRFATTRITDFHLREGIGERVQKDYRRFLARLEALTELSSDEVARRLGGRT